MKIIKVIKFTPFLVLLCACNNNSKDELKNQYASIKFISKSKNIGNIVLGSTKEIEFYAVNTSEVPLIIDSVKSSCTCTVSKFPKNPIQKNDSGLILAKYTPNKSNIGYIEKSIVVLSNTKPAFTALFFTGNVVVD